MRRAGSVEADAVRGRQRIDAAKWRQVVGHSETQSRKRRDIAAIGRELRDLLAADQSADFAGLRLHLQGVCLQR